MKPIPPGMDFWRAVLGGLVPMVEDAAYLDWVRTLPCCITGEPAEAHHVIQAGIKSSASKASDYLAIPLCPDLHRASNEGIHVLGVREWERRYGDQMVYVARTLFRAVIEGVLVRK